jgi:CPA2 family monovalent cation:H+ antiporter-2
VASDWLMQSVQMTTDRQPGRSTTDQHVIICGYGRCGQNLARLLEGEGIPYMALDLDPDRVRQAAAPGRFGGVWRRRAPAGADGRRPAPRQRRGRDLRRHASALKVLHHTHEQAVNLPVVVRTVDDLDLEKLREAGATEVVPEAIEASLMLASHALALMGVPMRRVLGSCRTSAMRVTSCCAVTSTAPTTTAPTNSSRSVSAPSPCRQPAAPSARRWPAWRSRRSGCGWRVCAAPNGLPTAFDDATVLDGGDTLVLSGRAPALALAEDRLLSH